MSHASAPDSRFLSEKSIPLGTRRSAAKSSRGPGNNVVDGDPTSPIVAPGASEYRADGPGAGGPAGSRDVSIRPLLEVTATTRRSDGPTNESADDRWQIGSVVAGRYVLLEETGTSGMGIVYKALDRYRESVGDTNPWVALKFARPDGEQGADTIDRLRHEFLTLSALRHPNIVAVHDVGRESGAEFLVLEWLSGETLASLLVHMGSTRLALRTARDIIGNVAKALSHAHEKGVVHGDVKPANIFISDDGSVKLIDFGAASKQTASASDAGRPSWATRSYASCEILEGQAAGPADDVFALGVTAYRLLGGDWPFGDLNAQMARERGMRPAELPEDPFDSGTAVHSALQLDIADRPADAAEFLRIFLGDSTPPQPGVLAQFPRLSTTVGWGGLAAVACVLLLVWATPEDVRSPAKVDRMLESAAEALSSGRLLEPIGDSAIDQYQQILTFEPGNPSAVLGIDRIADELVYRARSALNAENFDEAAANLQMARALRPDHLGVTLMQDLVGLFQRDLLLSAREALENDAARADEYIARATSMVPDSDPFLDELRRELQQQRTVAKVESLLRAIGERVLSEQLLVPKGDSALDLLQKARTLAPENYQVELAADRVASALLFQALFAVSNGDLDRAQSFIDAAASLEVRHLALARTRYELAKARNAVVQSQASDGQR